jgi:branched-chain amino acid transport system substrate-binding protein
MYKRILLIPLALLLAISLVAIGCPAPPEETTPPTTTLPTTAPPTTAPPPPKELKIGCFAMLTGFMANTVAPQERGVRAAADLINSEGGLTINGEKYLIKVVSEDTDMSADMMVSAANKMVFEDEIKFFVCAQPVSVIYRAALDMLEENKCLMMMGEGLGGKYDVPPEYDWLFYTTMCSNAFIGTIETFHELYPEVEKLVAVVLDDPGSIEANAQAREVLEAQGMTVVTEELVPFGTTDLYPTWTRINAQPKADAIFMIGGGGAEYGNVLKQGAELGWEGPFLGLGIGSDPYVMADITGPQYGTDILLPVFAFKSPEMPTEIKEMITVVHDMYGEELQAAHFIGWEQMQILAYVIKQAQSLDPAVVKDAWENIASIETPCGPGYMTGLEYYGLNHIIARPIPLCRVMDGDVEHFGWIEGDLP